MRDVGSYLQKSVVTRRLGTTFANSFLIDPSAACSDGSPSPTPAPPGITLSATSVNVNMHPLGRQVALTPMPMPLLPGNDSPGMGMVTSPFTISTAPTGRPANEPRLAWWPTELKALAGAS